MIIDSSIKKCIADNNDISEIHLESGVVWRKVPTTSTMIKGTEFNNAFIRYHESIQSFKLASDNITTPETGVVDISEAKDGTIIAWFDTNSGTIYYKPIGVDMVLLNEDCTKLFQSFKLTDLDFSKIDTSNVTNMSYMFNGCSLNTIPLLDTHNVTNMNNMFVSCYSLTTIPLLDTHNVTTMSNMFSYCNSLTTMPLLDTHNVTNMSYMFNGCTSLTSIPLLDTSNVTSMNGMFRECTSLTSVHELDTSKVTNMGGMFSGCTSLNSIPLLDMSKTNRTDSLFQNCTNLSSISISTIVSAQYISFMFDGCTSLTRLDLSTVDTSKGSSFNGFFRNCTKLTEIIYGEKFVNDSVDKYFSEMFLNCPANKPNWTNGTWDDTGTFTKNI